MAQLDPAVLSILLPDAQEMTLVSQLASESEDDLMTADAPLDPDDFVAFATEHETAMAMATAGEDDDEGALDVEPDVLLMDQFETAE